MGVLLNPDNSRFQSYRNMKIFVDKSDMIKCTNEVLNSNDAFICVSRPRRFGKTLAASMLEAYYSKSCDSHTLFDDLSISDDPNYEKHLNKYNVISVNIVSIFTKVKDLNEIVSEINDRIMLEIQERFGDYVNGITILSDALDNIYLKTKEKFIFIVDEWDCVFREAQDNVVVQKEYLNFLRGLLKDKNYVALAYMTGILPIKKYGTQSALNMFTERTMVNMANLAPFTGFTEDEVKELCDQYDIDFNEMKHWYDGYIVNGMHIYNPRSVCASIADRTFGSYWTSTETYESLKGYITMNFDGLKEAIVDMLTGNKCNANVSKFQNDLISFRSKDDVIALLVHLGYLSYERVRDVGSVSGFTDKVFIPNEEIRLEMVNAIEDSNWDSVIDALKKSNELLNLTLEGDEEAVANAIEKVHSDNTSIITYNNENSLSCVIQLAYYTARNEYSIDREMPTGKGFADFIFTPKQNVNKPPIIFELKFGKSADEAIEQIKSKDYTDILKSEGFSEAVLVGVNYNKDTKVHDCRIENLTLIDSDK